MGIELRKVPADWKHPTDSDFGNHRVSSLAFTAPRHQKWRAIEMNRSWDEAMRVWWWKQITDRLKRWVAYWPSVFGMIDPPSAVRYWEAADRKQPEYFYYRPRWGSWERTHYQLYETVSEGTPISPVMPSLEALAEWCAGQTKEVWVNTHLDYSGWMRFFSRGGWAPSGVSTPERGFESGVEFMAREETV